MALSRLLSLAWLALAVGAVAGAAAPPGPLGDLAAPRHGRPRHDGTWDRRGGNVDFRGLQAGQSLTLFETRGAGIVRRFWMTFFPREPALHRQLVLRMYWDGEATPSVERAWARADSQRKWSRLSGAQPVSSGPNGPPGPASPASGARQSAARTNAAALLVQRRPAGASTGRQRRVAEAGN